MLLSANPKPQISRWAQICTLLLRKSGGWSCCPSVLGGDPCTALVALLGLEHQAEAGGIAVIVLLCLGAFLPLPTTASGPPCDRYLWCQRVQDPAHFPMETERF